MKTHDNRALFSKALLKAATCFFLIAGAGMSCICTSGNSRVYENGNYTANCNSKRCGERQKGRTHHWCQYHGKGTANGTITDFDGKYTLNVKGSQSVLVISYIGYKTQEFEVKNNRKIDATLQEDTEVMDEVVVIGYGPSAKVM